MSKEEKHVKSFTITKQITIEHVIDAAHDLDNNERSGELYEDSHLLLLGRSGVGKSCLAGFLIDGVSRGVGGPKAGTKYHTRTTVKRGRATYHVHDTAGLSYPLGGEDRANLAANLKELVSQKKCLVLLCIRFDDRMCEDAHKVAFDVSHSLSDDIWKKVIVAVTHSDILPPDVDISEDNKIEELISDWKESIQLKLREIRLNDEDIKEVAIRFTAHTSKKNHVDPLWSATLIIALNQKIPDNDGVFQFLINKCLSHLEDMISQEKISELSEEFKASCTSSEQHKQVNLPENVTGFEPLSGSHKQVAEISKSEKVSAESVSVPVSEPVSEHAAAANTNFSDVLRGSISNALAALEAGDAEGKEILQKVQALHETYQIGATVGGAIADYSGLEGWARDFGGHMAGGMSVTIYLIYLYLMRRKRRKTSTT